MATPNNNDDEERSLFRDFKKLSMDGRNYLVWATTTKTELRGKKLLATLTDRPTKENDAERAQALRIIQRNLEGEMLTAYFAISEPKELWAQLQADFEEQAEIMLPNALADWQNLRFVDFSSVTKFNYELNTIANKLLHCGKPVSDDDKIQKTLTTFHPNDGRRARELRGKYKTYKALYNNLLAEEKEQQVLERNYNRNLPGYKPVPPPVNAVETQSTQNKTRRVIGKKGRGGNYQGKGRDSQKDRNPYSRENQKTDGTRCKDCGLKGHTADECRATYGHKALYREFMKRKQVGTGKTETETQHYESLGNVDFDDEEEYEEDGKEEEEGVEGEEESYMAIVNPVDEEEDSDIEFMLDSCTTHSILTDRSFFVWLDPIAKHSVKTITGTTKVMQQFGKASITLPNGMALLINKAVYNPKATRNLISFRDVRENSFHITTAVSNDIEYLYITKNGEIKETFKAYQNGLYSSECHSITTDKVAPSARSQTLWHARLGHPGLTMMRRIIPNTCGHKLSTTNLNNPTICTACIIGKLIAKAHKTKKDSADSAGVFLFRIQADVSGPIEPPCGPFHYYLVLQDSTGQWTDVILLSSRNTVFTRVLTSLLKLRATFPEHPIRKIRVDGAGEFTSQTFEDYCASQGIEIEYPVPHVHQMMGLAESGIKRVAMIARPLLMQSKLPSSAWGHAILHAGNLLKY